jgi:hypothetical protein
MVRFAIQQPSAIAGGHEEQEEEAKVTILRAAVGIIPEAKGLMEERQDLTVAVELEGVLHNCSPLPNKSLNVTFVVDNLYEMKNLASRLT